MVINGQRYFCTGDIGLCDAEGCLRIIGECFTFYLKYPHCQQTGHKRSCYKNHGYFMFISGCASQM